MTTPLTRQRAALRHTLGLLLLCASTLVQAQRSRTTLDGSWRFERGDRPEAAAPDFDDASFARVTLPHSWNATDGEAGGPYYLSLIHI